MEPVDMLPGATPTRIDDRQAPLVRLRLYVARSTPNSVRAQANLSAVLGDLKSEWARPALEIVDVFSQPKRAITDGIIVTPTLIGLSDDRRVVLMGDLSDRDRLEGLLQDLLS